MPGDFMLSFHKVIGARHGKDMLKMRDEGEPYSMALMVEHNVDGGWEQLG